MSHLTAIVRIKKVEHIVNSGLDSHSNCARRNAANAPTKDDEFGTKTKKFPSHFDKS